MRRATTVLLTGLLTAGGVAAAAPASAATAITPTALKITVTGVAPDGGNCVIDADLYVPHGVTAAHPAPAILTTNGFGGTKKDQADFAQSFGEHGYVTLAYTGLGFVGDSSNCPITLDDREHDGRAASQLIRFLGGDPAVLATNAQGGRVHVDQVVRDDGATGNRYDPRVGMVGGSYGGQIQFAAAAVEQEAGTKRLDAIIPQITWNDLSYSLDPNNQLPRRTAASGSVSSDVPGSFKYQWSLFFTGEGVADGLQNYVTSPAAAQSAFSQAVTRQNCGNFEVQVCQALAEVGATGYPGPESISYLRSNSVASYISDVRVPTFLAQGQADSLFDLQESMATYSTLKAQGTPVALQWQSWGHSHSAPVPGELDERKLERSYQGKQILAWFGHYLKGATSQPVPEFSYFRDWVYATTPQKTAADVAKAYTSGPLPGDRTQTWFLSGTSGPESQTTPTGASVGGGRLVPSASQVVPGTSRYSSVALIGPNYSETSAVESSLNPEPQPSDPPGTSVRFLTDALPCALDVVGSPRLTVRLDAPSVALTQAQGPAGELAVYAKVYDVGPTGAVELPRRLISPVRVADVTKPVTIELPGIVHRFAAGHRLAVVLAGGDLAYRGSTTSQPVTLTTGGSTDRLVVPLA